MVGDARQAVEMVRQEQVKTRKEVLAEQNIEKKKKKEKNQIDQRFKEFYAQTGYQA